MQFTPDNPFTALTSVVAPAVLTNACSVLALGTSNRIARVVDRVRVVSREIASLPEGSELCVYWEDQLAGLRVRAGYLFWSLRLLYASLAAFATAALVAIIGSALAITNVWTASWLSAALGLVVGSAGVGGLAAGCALMVWEVRMALVQTKKEADYALSHRVERRSAGTEPGA